jgi:uncharacterized protein
MSPQIKALSGVCCQRNPQPTKQRSEIESLIKAGADIDEMDKNGVTPLHHAVRFKNVEAVETLLEHGAAVNKQCKRSGSTALHRAVTLTGAPDTADKKAQTKQIIAILLRYGADPSIKNKSGKAALDYVRDQELRELLCP